MPGKELVRKFKENELSISNLSMTKYNQISQNQNLSTIHAVPDLSLQNKIDHRRDLSFLRFN